MIVDNLVSTFRNSTYRNPDKWFLDWFYQGQESDSGAIVNTKTSLGYAPVWEAVSFIAGDIGKLPFPVLKKTPAGRERDTNHPAYPLMMFEPNEAMTADVFREALQAHTLLCGNGRAVIVRDNAETPQSIVPLLPERCETMVANGEVVHKVKIGDGETKVYLDKDVLHIKGLGYDGIQGYSVVSMARNSFGLGMSEEKHGNRTFKNFAVPPMVLETEQRVTEPDAKKMLADWQSFHGGMENAGKTGLLHSGTKAHMLSVPNRDAQWLESRKFERSVVAGWFKMPPSKIGGDDHINYNSLEHFALAYLEGCILYWEVRWQQECRRKLLTERQKREDTHYFEFFNDALISVDFEAKVTALQNLVSSTIFNTNEAREKLNMNHRKGGDVYENPNTKPGAPAGTPEPKPVEQPPKPPRPRPTPEDLAKIADLLAPRIKGEAGERGVPGPAGPQGERGEAGPKGDAGEKGDRGDVGPQGPVGEKGDIGAAGADGKPGIDGKDGEQGPRGESGPEGAPSLYGTCLEYISSSITQEISIVRHHSGKAKNFTAWLESWYPKWEETFSAVVTYRGGDPAMAVEHCTESRRQLIELTGTATMETLSADVKTLTGSWHERGVVLARRIAGSESTEAPLVPGTMIATTQGLGTVKSLDSDWRYQVELQDGRTETVSGKDIEVLG